MVIFPPVSSIRPRTITKCAANDVGLRMILLKDCADRADS